MFGFISRISQSNLRPIVHGVTYLNFAQIITMLSTLAVSSLMARYIPYDHYGIYRYILSVAGILAGISLTGIGTAITQAVARGYERTFLLGVKYFLKWEIFSAILTFGLSLYYFYNGNTVFGFAFLCVGVTQPIISTAQLIDYYLNGKNLIKQYAINLIIINATTSLVLISIILITDNILTLICAYFISRFIIRVLLFLFELKKYPPNSKVDTHYQTYGKHLSAIRLLTSVVAHVDKILIFKLLGPVELATYAFAIAIPEQIKGFFKNIAAIIMPRFSARNSLQEIKNNMPYKILLLGFIFAAISVIYIFFAPYIFAVLFPTYTHVIIYSQIFALSFPAAISILPVSAFQSQKESRKIYQLHLFSSITQLIIVYLAISLWGLWGAILSRVITRYINTVFSFYLL